MALDQSGPLRGIPTYGVPARGFPAVGTTASLNDTTPGGGAATMRGLMGQFLRPIVVIRVPRR